MLQIDEHVFRNMLAETAVAAEWRKVSLVPYVKQQLVLIAVDEAHCIPEWLVQYIIDVQLFRSTLYTFMCLYTYRGVEFSKAFKHVGELRALVDVPFMALTPSTPSPIQIYTHSTFVRPY